MPAFRWHIIFFYLGENYSDDLTKGVRFATALFALSLSEKERREILTKKYNIPKREYPKRESIITNSIYEDTKRRFLREGREEGREEGERKRIEDLAGVVSSVMQKMDVPLEEALEITSISDEDRPLIIDRLSSS